MEGVSVDYNSLQLFGCFYFYFILFFWLPLSFLFSFILTNILLILILSVCHVCVCVSPPFRTFSLLFIAFSFDILKKE